MHLQHRFLPEALGAQFSPRPVVRSALGNGHEAWPSHGRSLRDLTLGPPVSLIHGSHRVHSPGHGGPLRFPARRTAPLGGIPEQVLHRRRLQVHPFFLSRHLFTFGQIHRISLAVLGSKSVGRGLKIIMYADVILVRLPYSKDPH
uniref:Uncharacterized protein n=1 Tax=Micrurus paraensis TaxID=1970185 RepID=A0A2D4L3S4_9SAUR